MRFYCFSLIYIFLIFKNVFIFFLILILLKMYILISLFCKYDSCILKQTASNKYTKHEEEHSDDWSSQCTSKHSFQFLMWLCSWKVPIWIKCLISLFQRRRMAHSKNWTKRIIYPESTNVSKEIGILFTTLRPHLVNTILIWTVFSGKLDFYWPLRNILQGKKIVWGFPHQKTFSQSYPLTELYWE